MSYNSKTGQDWGLTSMEARTSKSESFFTSAQSSEVLSCFWDNVGTKLHHNASNWLSTNGHVKVHFRIAHCAVEKKDSESEGNLLEWSLPETHTKRNCGVWVVDKIFTTSFSGETHDHKLILRSKYVGIGTDENLFVANRNCKKDIGYLLLQTTFKTYATHPTGTAAVRFQHQGAA
jgi:hypothetical protein